MFRCGCASTIHNPAAQADHVNLFCIRGAKLKDWNIGGYRVKIETSIRRFFSSDLSSESSRPNTRGKVDAHKLAHLELGKAKDKLGEMALYVTYRVYLKSLKIDVH